MESIDCAVCPSLDSVDQANQRAHMSRLIDQSRRRVDRIGPANQRPVDRTLAASHPFWTLYGRAWAASRVPHWLRHSDAPCPSWDARGRALFFRRALRCIRQRLFTRISIRRPKLTAGGGGSNSWECKKSIRRRLKVTLVVVGPDFGRRCQTAMAPWRARRRPGSPTHVEGVRCGPCPRSPESRWFGDDVCSFPPSAPSCSV